MARKSRDRRTYNKWGFDNASTGSVLRRGGAVRFLARSQRGRRSIFAQGESERSTEG